MYLFYEIIESESKPKEQLKVSKKPKSKVINSDIGAVGIMGPVLGSFVSHDSKVEDDCDE